MNTVKVMIRAKLDGKYPYLPAVVNGNGRIKPGVALIGGVEQKVEGSYYPIDVCAEGFQAGSRWLTRTGDRDLADVIRYVSAVMRNAKQLRDLDEELGE
jgi:hypothetical protein